MSRSECIVLIAVVASVLLFGFDPDKAVARRVRQTCARCDRGVVTCRACHGSGRQVDRKCSECDGRGALDCSACFGMGYTEIEVDQ